MIAVDTNVLIYACDQSEPHRQTISLDLIASATEGVLLWQVACEFLSASRKLSKQGFTPVQAWNRLAEFRDLFPIRIADRCQPDARAGVARLAQRFAMGRPHSRCVRRSWRGRSLLGGCAWTANLRNRACDQSIQMSLLSLAANEAP